MVSRTNLVQASFDYKLHFSGAVLSGKQQGTTLAGCILVAGGTAGQLQGSQMKKW